MADSDDRAIDLWGFALGLWRHKWVWLTCFAIVMALGSGYALTRPRTYQVTQQVLLSLPTVSTEAQASQQAAALSPTALTYVEFAQSPRVTEPLTKQFPELDTPEAARAAVSVTLRNVLLLEFSATDDDPSASTKLVKAFAASFVESLPRSTATMEPHLRLNASLLDEPVVLEQGSGRALVLGASALVAIAVATLATALVRHRRERSSAPVA